MNRDIVMNTAALLKITTFLPVIAALTLSGCGGGGSVRDTDGPVSSGPGGQPPVSDEAARLNAALDRAQVAENAAWSSAAQAALQCQAAVAACQAAEDATTAALLAEGANERAQNAMTADQAERAADVAEQAATRAATAAADAVRLAGGGGTEQPSETPEWLLPGTIANTAAGTNAIEHIERVLRAVQARDTVEGDYIGFHSRMTGFTSKPGSTYNGRGTTILDYDTATFITPHSGDLPGYCGNYLTCQYSWGIWSHPTMSGTITKVEEAHKTTHSSGSNTVKHKTNQIFGLMDHSYFGIAFDYSSHATPQDRNDYSAFYATDDEFPNAIADDRGSIVRTPDLSGATWSGDAFGIRISSETLVFGQAALAITGERNPSDVPFRNPYTLQFNVHWNNGDTVQIDGYAGEGDHNLVGPFGISGTNADPDTGDYTHYVTGMFAGPQAEEAVGFFRTPEYVGAFGAERQ